MALSGAVKGITVKIDGDTTGLGQAFNKAKSQCAKLDKELKAVNKALKLDPTNVNLLSKKQETLAKAVQAATDKVNGLKAAQEQVETMYRDGKIDSGAYLEFQNELQSAENELKRLQDAQKEFGSVSASVMEAAGQKIQDFGKKVEKVGDNLASVGKDVTKKVTTPIMAVGGAAVAAFKAVDEGADKIAIATGASGEALAGLTDSYEEVATRIPAELGDVADAIGEVNTRFQTTGPELENQSELFLKFAAITGGDVVTSVDNADKIMETWGKTNGELPGLLGMVAKSSQDTGLSAQKLMGDVMANSASFKELGWTLEESINFMAQMDANGVDASTALSGLKKSVTNLTDAGMSEKEALAQVIDGIKNATTETEALDLAEQTFGKKGAAEMATAIREGRIDLDSLSGSLTDYGGVVEETYGNTVDGLDKATTAMNAAKFAGAELGQTISDMAAPYIEKFTEKIKGVTEKLKGMDDGQKQTIVRIAGVVAAIGPGLTIAGKVISTGGKIITGIGKGVSFASKIPGAVGKVTSVFGKLHGGVKGLLTGFLALPMPVKIAIGAIAAIAAVVGIFKMLYNHCEKFRNFVDTLPGKISGAVGKVKGFFTDMGNGIKDTFGKVKESATKTWNGVKEKISDTCGKVKEKWGDLKASTSETFGKIHDKVTTTWQNTTEAVKQAGEKGLEALKTTTAEKLGNVQSAYEEHGGGVKGVMAATWEGLKATQTFGLSFIDNLTGGKLTEIKDKFLTTPVGKAWTTTMDGVKRAGRLGMETLHNTTVEKLDRIQTAYQENGGGVRGIVSATMTGIGEIQTFGLDYVNNLTGGKLSAVRDHFATKMEAARGKVSTALGSIRESFSSKLSEAHSTVTSIMDNIKGAFSEKIEAAHQAVSNAVEKIKGAFNFSWSLPHLNLPHVSVSGGVAPYGIGGKGSLPQFSVDWYAQGGVLNKAQIFGALGDKLLGGGEAGPEAVLPLRSFYDNLGKLLDARLGPQGGGGGNFYQYNTYNSPKDLSPGESARLTRNETRKLLARAKLA